MAIRRASVRRGWSLPSGLTCAAILSASVVRDVLVRRVLASSRLALPVKRW